MSPQNFDLELESVLEDMQHMKLMQLTLTDAGLRPSLCLHLLRQS